MKRNRIIRDILSFIQEHGGLSRSWYVGISQDARVSLFAGHRVSESTGVWIHRAADNFLVAREVEDYFVNNFRTDGASEPADIFAAQVYAYKKTRDTKP